MKILLINLNVGSGIEYVGNKVKYWLNEIPNTEIIEYKIQTCVSLFTDDLIKIQPDFVIVNEYFPRIIEPLYYYKRYNPHVKILFIPHSWKFIVDMPPNMNTHLSDRMIDIFVKDACDKIICLSQSPAEKKYKFGIQSKTNELYMPVSKKDYKIITPWKDRKKLFGHFGGVSENRLSQKFVDGIKHTDIHIDYYGEDKENRLNQIPNLIPHPRIKQEDMPVKLNEYKFFVLPHNGSEVFFITLLQSIMCGTIPLVVNDKNTKNFDPRWIDWADKLYFGNDDVETFIQNLERLSQDTNDFAEISNSISYRAHLKFDEDIIKKEIIDFINK